MKQRVRFQIAKVPRDFHQPDSEVRYTLQTHDGQYPFLPVSSIHWIFKDDSAFMKLSETLEEAWALVKPDEYDVIAPETPLFKYSFHLKSGNSIEYYSEFQVLPGGVWACIQSLNAGYVMVAMSEVERLTVREI